jgi:hypothetical protein
MALASYSEAPKAGLVARPCYIVLVTETAALNKLPRVTSDYITRTYITVNENRNV